ncbi:MAG TPA: carboxypeptidase-like regulatory domain-containing protein [Terriglobales bacterium]|nr:carboxypeptidase-like regulatory domain-containing protein [Terriglobales bacterium]
MRLTGRLLPLAALFVTWATLAVAQGNYRAQLRGVVSDASGAVVPNATVTIKDVGTNIASTARTDGKGSFFFTGLRPSTYDVTVEATGFRSAEKTGVVLAVDQESSLSFKLDVVGTLATINVTTTAPLLDTDNATLGTDITSEYVKELPLANRNFFGMTFLSAGVTEVAGSGTSDNYPSGTNFVSNGQRNATAEVRLDGALISAPEQGEGGNSNVYYEPLVESVQEFKVENNSFSAEFGNNGGTVVNMVMKSGTNAFHGSGWYFLQRPQMDARDFFNPAPSPKPDSKRDQGGFSIGGPIVKNKTFFFADYEKVSSYSATSSLASVPTVAQRSGNFGPTATDPTPNLIYDPTQPTCTPSLGCVRPLVPGNIIPGNEIDQIGLAVLNLYPQPNVPGAGEFNNFQFTTPAHQPDYQFDIKVDHKINERQSVNARYSRGSSDFSTPFILGDGFDNDGIKSDSVVAQNGSFEYTWTISPRVIWTNHAAIDRVHELETPNGPTISSLNASLPAGAQGLPAVLQTANGVDRLPSFFMNGASSWSNLFDQCCTNTTFAHTLYSYSSQFVISKGSHLMKFGGEQRLFYNNFFQPSNPTGGFNFSDYVTSPTPNSETDGSGNPTGNPFASLLFGYADNVNPFSQEPTALTVLPSVANKSAETGFYFQDDWKVNSKLTVNLGVRYQWSTPYNERHNRIEFSDFTTDTGVNIPLNFVPSGAPAGTSSAQALLLSQGVSIPASQELFGTTQFPTSGNRSVPVYRKDVGPRLGFAYAVDSKTVVRGGAGIYFGMSPATNFQYPGTAFRKTATMFFTNDNFQTQSATLENPFPSGFTGPQGKQYGALANWGYGNNNDLGTTAARDANIYQWNLGIQRELPSQIVLGMDYSANRSTHLPWSGTNNQDFIPSALLAQITAAVTPTDPTCLMDACVSSFLQTQVGNPFAPLFNSPCSPSPSNPCFNEPNSNYFQSTLPLGNLLVKYPQFSGDFEGLALEEASSWYHALQIRFQKRTTHHISFEGSYTVSKSTDDSSAGRNNWVGTLGSGQPQQLDRLNLEHSISANDTPQRLALAVVVDMPIGRNQWIGEDMNRALDSVVGGWSIATLITAQSGQPMAIALTSPQLANGTQRPDVLCSHPRTGLSMNDVALTYMNATPATFFNPNCFANPGDQTPGNAPRYFSNLRVDGIHNVDLNLYKSFVPKEGTKIEVRAEMFNFFNHPRFGQPNSNFGDPLFGTIPGNNADAPGYVPRTFQFGVRFEF